MSDGTKYRTFIRSVRSWKDFASARKTTVDRNLTGDEALRACKNYNDNRTARQISRGTKMEFDSQ